MQRIARATQRHPVSQNKTKQTKRTKPQILIFYGILIKGTSLSVMTKQYFIVTKKKKKIVPLQ